METKSNIYIKYNKLLHKYKIIIKDFKEVLQIILSIIT